MRIRTLTFLFLSLCALLSDAHGEIRLPGFYTDHMVLHCQKPLRLRGWGAPGEQVKCRFAERPLQRLLVPTAHGR